jgi:hypothetical protein
MFNRLIHIKKYFKIFYIGLLLLFSTIWMLPPFFALEKGIQGIDPSWKIATTLALENGWVWGEDIVFTYGPLAFLSTRFLDNIPGFFLLLFDIFILGQLGIFLYRSLSLHFNIITGLYLILLW